MAPPTLHSESVSRWRSLPGVRAGIWQRLGWPEYDFGLFVLNPMKSAGIIKLKEDYSFLSLYNSGLQRKTKFGSTDWTDWKDNHRTELNSVNQSSDRRAAGVN